MWNLELQIYLTILSRWMNLLSYNIATVNNYYIKKNFNNKKYLLKYQLKKHKNFKKSKFLIFEELINF